MKQELEQVLVRLLKLNTVEDILLNEFDIDQPIIVKRGNDSISVINLTEDKTGIWFNIDTDEGGYTMTFSEVFECFEDVIKHLIEEVSDKVLGFQLKDRQDIITELITDSIDSVLSADRDYGDITYIDSIFRGGFVGYNNESDEKLEQLFYEAFDNQIIIYAYA